MADDLIVTFNKLPAISAELQRVVSQIVRKAAFDIEAAAKAQAPVDTGALKNSIYTVTSDSSDYSGGDMPQVDTPANDHTAYVAVGMSYGIYQEYGTSHMPAQPYMTPAVEGVRPSFIAAMSAVESKLNV